MIRNEKGQALIFVVATMTVALAVGVGVSLRNLSSISRTSRTDTAARAQAAAEGGAENVLSRSESELLDLVAQTINQPLIIEFAPAAGTNEDVTDNITATATVTVQPYNIPAGSNFFPLDIKRDQVSEVKLDASTVSVDICWTSQEAGRGSDIYYSAYALDGEVVRGGIEAIDRSGSLFPSGYTTGGTFDTATGGTDFVNCANNISLPGSPAGIRIKSINADSTVGVYPGGSLPDQGYLITSIGRLQNLEEGEGPEAEAVVTVIRSAPFMPGIFDFGIFSGSSGEALN